MHYAGLIQTSTLSLIQTSTQRLIQTLTLRLIQTSTLRLASSTLSLASRLGACAHTLAPPVQSAPPPSSHMHTCTHTHTHTRPPPCAICPHHPKSCITLFQRTPLPCPTYSPPVHRALPPPPPPPNTHSCSALHEVSYLIPTPHIPTHAHLEHGYTALYLHQHAASIAHNAQGLPQLCV